MDITSKSDPVCVLCIKRPGEHNWIQFAKTEIIRDNLNPNWVKKFEMDYKFEERQVRIYLSHLSEYFCC